MRIKEFTVSALALSANGIATTFQPVAGTPATLLVTALSPPREIAFTSALDLSATSFTIVGLDRFGNRITETVGGLNANTVSSRGVYAGLISITPTVSVGLDMTIGWTNRVPGPWVHMNTYEATDGIPEPSIYVTATGGASEFSIETTNEHLTGASRQGDVLVDPAVVVAPNAVASGVTEYVPAFEKSAFFRVVKTGASVGALRVRVARPRF
jgi:hypothetical protein